MLASITKKGEIEREIGLTISYNRLTPLKGNRVFAPPYASCLSTFRGTPAILPPCRWRNATSWKLVPFSHRSASRIFIMQPGCTPSPAVTQDGDLQFDGGGKQAGLLKRPDPLGLKCELITSPRRLVNTFLTSNSTEFR